MSATPPEPDAEDAPGLAGIRDAVRRDLDYYTPSGGSWEEDEVVAVALLTRTLVELERLVTLDEAVHHRAAKLEGELTVVEAGLEELVAAADDVIAATNGLAVDDFPPRVEAIVAPIRELEALRGRLAERGLA